MMHKRANTLKSSLISLNMENSKLAEDLRAVELERISLNEKLEKLKSFESKYLGWKKREPEIEHYLAQFTGLAK